MAYKPDLTDAQTRIFDEAEARLAKLMEETQAKLEAADFRFSDGDWSCRFCDCDHFTGRPGHPCRTPGCGHGFMKHHVI